MILTAVIPQDLRTTASPTFAAVNAGTLTITSASITDSSGSIGFGNENLNTTGWFRFGTIDTGDIGIKQHDDFAGDALVIQCLDGDFANTRIAIFPAVDGGTRSSFDLYSQDDDPTTSNAHRLRILNDGTSATIVSQKIGTGTAEPLIIQTESNDYQIYLEETSGYVGILTNSPAYQLDVNGTVRIGTDAILTGVGDFTLTGVDDISFTSSTGIFSYNGSGADVEFGFAGGTNTGVFTWMEDEDYFKFSDDMMLVGGENIILDTSTGTKIGTSTSQLLGFYNATPVNQPDTVSDATTQDLTGTDTIDQTKLESDLSGIVTAVNTVIDRLQELGLIA